MNGAPPLLDPPPPPAPTPAAKRTGWVVYSVIATVLLFVSLLTNLVLFAMAIGGGGQSLGRQGRYLEFIIADDGHTRNKIAVIYLTGIISAEADGYTSEEGMVGDIKDQLRQAIDDKHVKAIVLRINSPGGEVVASDSIYEVVATARDQKPVVASIDSVGASGAYYAAMGADYVMANELSITGSIGVILQSYTFTDLMGKIGVHSYTFKSGRYKDVLNPMREPTEDEKALVQDLIAEVYEKFVGIVAAEREIKVEELKAGMADGRILSGKQALEAGLVDGVGYFEDAIEKAKELANIQKARVIRYAPPFSFRNLFQLYGQPRDTQIQVQLAPQTIKLDSGKLYYLPANMFR
jgi:protease-4